MSSRSFFTNDSVSKVVDKNIILILSIIVLLAFVLRIALLTKVPIGFFIDEASTGYDAYSILHTLKDHHGKFLPLFARALDDYRPSTYIFLTIPFVHFLGLSELSIRLPSAIVGTLTVITIYFLTQQLLGGKKQGLVAAFLLAISPWHIQFSRIAFEAILLPFLFSLGLLFFCRSFNKPSHLILSALFFGFSLHTYQSARVFVPLFLIVLSISFKDHLWRIRKQTLISTFVFLLIFVPLFSFWITPEGMARARATGISFNASKVVYAYLSYFSSQFLFASGDSTIRHSPLRVGELHIFEFVTVWIGVFLTIKAFMRNRGTQQKILLIWLFLYPIPAALITPTNAVRAIAGVMVFPMFSTIGIFYLWNFIRIPVAKRIVAAMFICLLSLGGFAHRYFLDYPTYSAADWQFGIKQGISKAQAIQSQIFVSNAFLYHCVYIHILFYTQYPPLAYQQAPIDEDLNLGNIGKFSILSLDKQNALYEGAIWMIPPSDVEVLLSKGYEMEDVEAIKDLRGDVVLRLVRIIVRKSKSTSELTA